MYFIDYDGMWLSLSFGFIGCDKVGSLSHGPRDVVA